MLCRSRARPSACRIRRSNLVGFAHQCSSSGSNCGGGSEFIADDEVVEWGVLPIDQAALAHPVDTVDDFEACLPSPHVARMGAARCQSVAP